MPENFASELRAARAAAGLTQRAAAEILGVPQRTYEKWEICRATPAPYVRKGVLSRLRELPATVAPAKKVRGRAWSGGGD
jgi:transcriptional regulator with XRE-family HTH domain